MMNRGSLWGLKKGPPSQYKTVRETLLANLTPYKDPSKSNLRPYTTQDVLYVRGFKSDVRWFDIIWRIHQLVAWKNWTLGFILL